LLAGYDRLNGRLSFRSREARPGASGAFGRAMAGLCMAATTARHLPRAAPGAAFLRRFLALDEDGAAFVHPGPCRSASYSETEFRADPAPGTAGLDMARVLPNGETLDLVASDPAEARLFGDCLRGDGLLGGADMGRAMRLEESTEASALPRVYDFCGLRVRRSETRLHLLGLVRAARPRTASMFRGLIPGGHLGPDAALAIACGVTYDVSARRFAFGWLAWPDDGCAAAAVGLSGHPDDYERLSPESRAETQAVGDLMLGPVFDAVIARAALPAFVAANAPG
jgi:hypothetical protein